MSDPYLDALEQLDQMRDRAFKAEAARDRLANQLLNEVPDSYIQMKARALDAEAAIQRVRELWTTCSCDRCTTNHLAILRALAVDGDSDEDGAE
jgi:hypothetical protein